MSDGSPSPAARVRDHLRSVGSLVPTVRCRRTPRPASGADRTPSRASTREVRRDGDEVVADHVFERRHSGAPGIAHGGAVATVVDDVLFLEVRLEHFAQAPVTP